MCFEDWLAREDPFNDGNIDLVIEDLDGQPEILRNHGMHENHWIGLELQGTEEQSPRDRSQSDNHRR